MQHPSQQELLEWFIDGGNFLVWKKRPPRSTSWPGCPAGTVGERYHQTKFKGVMYYTHRLLWILRHGDIPDGKLVDHINSKDRYNNEDYNLRLANDFQNQMNRKYMPNNTGVKGVYKCRDGTFKARYSINGHRVELNRFKTLEEASKALQEAREIAHGEFCNHG